MDEKSPDRTRHVAVRRAVVRTFAAVTGLVVVYFVVPFDWGDDWALVRTAAGVVVLAVIVVWQLRSIHDATYPRLRAAVLVTLTVAVSAVTFAAAYLAASNANPPSFNEPLDHIDALYFSLTVLSTVGFGDIHAVSSITRVMVTMHIVINVAVITVAARMAFAVAGAAAAKHAGSAGS